MRLIARVFLPLLLFIYIATETYLKLQHTSLCGEVGCKLAGELLNFDPLYLNYFGLLGVLILTVLGFLSLKRQLYTSLFFIALYSAIAFEATILSYQFVSNPEPCIFCLGIFSSLLLIALVSSWRHFAITLTTVLAIFVGLNALAVTKNKAFVTSPGNYLIQSASCPHCIKVKAYLKEHHIPYTPISTQEASARSFLKFIGTTSIPVLILKEKYKTVLLTGDKKIIAYFEQQKNPLNATQTEEKVTNTSLTQSKSNLGRGGLSADFLSAGGDDEGCAITITKTPDCTDTNTSH